MQLTVKQIGRSRITNLQFDNNARLNGSLASDAVQGVPRNIWFTAVHDWLLSWCCLHGNCGYMEHIEYTQGSKLIDGY